MRRVLLLLLLSTPILAAAPERGALVENVATRLDATQTTRSICRPTTA